MGCRVLRVAPFLVEQFLLGGTDSALDPISPPKDLRVKSARMNQADPVHPVLELLVESSTFEGGDLATFETAETWTAQFRRRMGTASSGKDARRGK